MGKQSLRIQVRWKNSINMDVRGKYYDSMRWIELADDCIQCQALIL
jgi:hypothetical protein